MSQDLRELFKKERERQFPMPDGHQARFEARLEQAFRGRRNRSYLWIGIAASLVLLLGWVYWMQPSDRPLPAGEETLVQQPAGAETTPAGLSLGDLSPDLRKLEEYYMASISVELASLDISEDNQQVANDFIHRLSDLNTEYDRLLQELNEIGPNEETITAMIKNLQYRLQLLLKLKEKLNELKSSENETIQNISA